MIHDYNVGDIYGPITLNYMGGITKKIGLDYGDNILSLKKFIADNPIYGMQPFGYGRVKIIHRNDEYSEKFIIMNELTGLAVRSGESIRVIENGKIFDIVNDGYITLDVVIPDEIVINPGQTVYDLDLRGENLSGRNLSNVTFDQCSLADSNLSGSDLRGANFTGADLSGCDLSGCDLSGANLKGLDLRYVTLSGSNLTGASLQRSNLGYLDLKGTDFTNAVMYRADLSNCRLGGAILTNAILVDANMDSADLSDSNLRGVNFTRADLSGADLSRADLTDANLSYITQDDQTNFNGAILTNIISEYIV